MVTDIVGANTDQMDKSLLNRRIGSAGSCCAQEIFDFVSRGLESSSYLEPDEDVTCEEICGFLHRNRKSLHGLRKIRLDLYAYKLLKAAMIFTIRGQPDLRVQGFAAMYTNRMTQEAYITICVVSEQYRSHKLGTMLFRSMEHAARNSGMKWIRFVTSIENTQAQELYCRLGYKDIKRVKNAGRMGVLYEKDLTIGWGCSSGDCNS